MGADDMYNAERLIPVSAAVDLEAYNTTESRTEVPESVVVLLLCPACCFGRFRASFSRALLRPSNLGLIDPTDLCGAAARTADPRAGLILHKCVPPDDVFS